MESAIKYKDQFLEEAWEFMAILKHMLEGWDDFLMDPQGDDELFRTVHSLKSGAAFLGYNGLEKQAHNLEDYLSRGAEDKELLRNRIKELVDLLHSKEWTVPEETAADQISTVENPSSSSKKLSQMQLRLIREAKHRGEKLYRVECHIDREEPMKKARAFLLLNNLELKCNVITSEPSLDDEEGIFNPFIIFLTTSKSPDLIERWVSVDRIDRIQMKEISMDQVDQLNITGQSLLNDLLEPQLRSLQIQRHELDEMKTLWEQLILSLQGTRLEVQRGKRIGRILLQGRKKIKEISGFQPAYIFPELKERILNYAKSQGKEILIDLQGGQLELPREWKNPLFRLVQQLIRNSLSHGIEEPQERISKGKAEQGKVTLDFKAMEDQIRITYSDDGRGVDELALRRRAADFISLEQASSMALLDLLLMRGLSTQGEATLQAGRGMGMDLLAQIVEKEMGGTMTLHNQQGAGVQIEILLPRKGEPGYLEFRYDGKSYLISLGYVRSTALLKPEKLWKNKKGEYHYKEKQFTPLYTPNGKVYESHDIKNCNYKIDLKFLGRSACLAVGELVSERQIKQDELPELTWQESPLMPLEDGLVLVLPNLIE